MTINASSVKGLSVFDLSQSKNIDQAEDVVYNPDAKKIEAILIKGSKAILINEVKNIGKDAVVIESSQVIKKETELPESISSLIKAKKTLPKNKVMTESGVTLGKISDLLFDPSTGMVKGFELSQGPIKDVQTGKKTIKIDEVINMNEEMMVVKSTAEEETKKQSEERGIKGTITKLSSAVKEKTQEKPKVPNQDLKTEEIQIRQNNQEKPEKIEGSFNPSESPRGTLDNLNESKKD